MFLAALFRPVIVSILASSLLAACAVTGGSTTVAGGTLSPTDGAAAKPLSGTSWRFVEFRSMDDATGVLVPDDPSRFTMRLDTDGTVNMKLGCNLANGTWRATPAGDGSTGQFEFGPLAATRALCAPPHLDERIVGQASYVRGYLLKNGRLYLTLMADGGVFAWEPLEAE